MTTILGFDPGSHQSGYALIDVRGGIGMPITATFIGGGVVVSTETPVRELLASMNPNVVAVEWVQGISYGAKGGGVVPHLIASAAVAGGIEWVALGRGIRTVRLPARDWRRTLFALPHASDKDIAHRLPGLFAAGWPKKSNVHQRDAAGCALACAWSLMAGRRSA